VFTPPDTCPVCGEAVPRGARACPGCGADERSGWDEETTRGDALDLPDAAYRDEAEPAKPRSTRAGLWLVIGLGLLVALVFSLIFR
jgi:hypothetical protein